MDFRLFPAVIVCFIAILFLLFSFYNNFIPSDIIYINNDIVLDDGKVVNIFHDKIDISKDEIILNPYKKAIYRGKNKDEINFDSEYKFLTINDNITLGNYLNNSYIKLIGNKIFTIKISKDKHSNNIFTIWNDSKSSKNIKYYDCNSNDNKFTDKLIIIKPNEIIKITFRDNRIYSFNSDSINNNYKILDEYLLSISTIYFDELLSNFHKDIIIIIEDMLSTNNKEKELYKETLEDKISLLSNEILFKLSNINLMDSISKSNEERNKVIEEISIIENKVEEIFSSALSDKYFDLSNKNKDINLNLVKDTNEKIIILLDKYKSKTKGIEDKISEIFTNNVTFKDYNKEKHIVKLSEIIKELKFKYFEDLEDVYNDFNLFLKDLLVVIFRNDENINKSLLDSYNKTYTLVCKNIISYIKIITNIFGNKLKTIKDKLSDDQKIDSFNILKILLRVIKNDEGK